MMMMMMMMIMVMILMIVLFEDIIFELGKDLVEEGGM